MLSPINFSILMYHNVCNSTIRRKESLFVSPSIFRKQLTLLKRVFKIDLFDVKTVVSDLSKIAITFDDGLEFNFLNLLPVLCEYEIKGHFFIPTSFVGKVWDLGMFKMMDWKMIKEMSDLGMDIGSHSITHPILKRCNRKQIRDEVVNSKKQIEDVIGKEVKGFCYPFGCFTEYVVETVRNAGYKFAMSTINDNVQDSLFVLNRIGVSNKTDIYKLIGAL